MLGLALLYDLWGRKFNSFFSLEERETSTRNPTKPDKFQTQTNLKFAVKQIEKVILACEKNCIFV
jgi:hypothetical protein